MKLITTDEQLRSHIPNVLATVEGEASLLEKLTPFLEQAEQWAAATFTGQDLLESITANISPVGALMQRLVVTEAFRCAVPSLDVVLTPNGYGIVSNSNIAPASKERVERLVASLEQSRDDTIALLLLRLPQVEDWHQTAQAQFFAATMFPTLMLCDKLLVTEHRWQQYLALREKVMAVENRLANEFFSQEQMAAFRVKLAKQLPVLPLERSVMQAIRTVIIANVAGKPLHQQAYFDIVNTLRNNPDVFPEWSASETAALFEATFFVNDKESSGYWF